MNDRTTLTPEREAEIRAFLATDDNASPSCAGCNEHVLLCALDESRAELRRWKVIAEEIRTVAHQMEDERDAALAEVERIQGWGDNTMTDCLKILTKASAALTGVLVALDLGPGASAVLEEIDEAIRQMSVGQPEGKD